MDARQHRKITIPKIPTIPMIGGLLMLSAALFTIQAQAPESVWDGAYSQGQAQRGEAEYKQQCAACHGDALEGDAQTDRGKQLMRVLPPLSGDVFKGNWNGRPLSDLFDKVIKTMPRDDPGKISRTQSADIIAYILKFNGFPAGKAEMPADPSLLTDTLFESVKPKK
jgi:quinoprotein glucose dehydrogenase